MSSPDERMRILQLVERGQVSAQEGARLLESLGDGLPAPRERTRQPVPRTLRVKVTDTRTNRQKVNVALPAGLLSIGLRLGARLARNEHPQVVETVRSAIDSGLTGRVYELNDLEEHERIEFFVE